MHMIQVLIWAAAQAASVATPPAPIEYGPSVSYSDGVEIGEAFIKADLADPASAQFEWPYRFVQFTEKVPLFKRTTGYASCFTYNAKNAMGGYVGSRMYRIIIRDGKVIDYMAVSDLRFVPDICKELITKFGMRPAPTPKLPLGITFQPSLDGALVLTVARGSLAEAVGIKAGDVVDVLNGIDVKGKTSDKIAAIMLDSPDALSIGIKGKAALIVDRSVKPSM
jgi:hypothetical protein